MKMHTGISIVLVLTETTMDLDSLLLEIRGTCNIIPYELLILDSTPADNTAEIIARHATHAFIRHVRIPEAFFALHPLIVNCHAGEHEPFGSSVPEGVNFLQKTELYLNKLRFSCVFYVFNASNIKKLKHVCENLQNIAKPWFSEKGEKRFHPQQGLMLTYMISHPSAMDIATGNLPGHTVTPVHRGTTHAGIFLHEYVCEDQKDSSSKKMVGIIEKRTKNKNEITFYRILQKDVEEMETGSTPYLYGMVECNDYTAIFLENLNVFGNYEIGSHYAKQLGRKLGSICCLNSNIINLKKATCIAEESLLTLEENLSSTVNSFDRADYILKSEEFSFIKKEFKLIYNIVSQLPVAVSHGDITPKNLGISYNPFFIQNEIKIFDWDKLSVDFIGSDLHAFYALAMRRKYTHNTSSKMSDTWNALLDAFIERVSSIQHISLSRSDVILAATYTAIKHRIGWFNYKKNIVFAEDILMLSKSLKLQLNNR